MQLPFTFKSAMVWALVLLVAGCAKTNVRSFGEVTYTGLPKPERVLICNFAVSPADIKENASIVAKIGRSVENNDQTAEELQLGREVADALATELMVKIAEMGLNPLRVTPIMPIPQDAIMITGHFVNIDEGNRLRRNVIGLGMGKSSLDCTVSILASMSSGLHEITAFDAHVESGKMPGVAVMGPAGAATGANTGAVVATNVGGSGVKSYKSASAQQAKGMADSIAAELKKYFAQQGWITSTLAK